MESKNVPGKTQIGDRFTNAMFFRAWWPALLSSVGWSLSDVADAVVVGQHLGTVGLASISLILPVYMINCMFAHGLGTGGGTKYAALMAHGKRTEARQNATCIYLAALLLSGATAVLGLVFLHPLLHILGTVPSDGALFEATKAYLRIQLLATPLFYFANIFNYYLRNDGMHRIAGIGSLTGNLCDIALNFVLVLGLQMGTGGAALATALGQVISISIYLPGILKKNHCLRFVRPVRHWLKEAFSLLRRGLSVSVQYLYQMIFLLMCNNILMRIGGETGIAVFDLLQNTSYLILYLYEGTARAMQPVISTYYSENNLPGLRNLFRVGFLSGIGAGLVVILLAVIRPELVCLLFGLAGSSAQPLACTAIRIFCSGAFFAGISILTCNYLLSRGLAFYAFWLETFRGALILIPAALVCSFMGLDRFWLLYPITEIISLVIVLLWILIRNRITPLFVVSLSDERIFRRTVLSTSSDIGQTSVDLKDFCEQWQASTRQKYTVMLTVEEVGMTILKHGFEGVGGDPAGIPDTPAGTDPPAAGPDGQTDSHPAGQTIPRPPVPLSRRIAAWLKFWRHRSDKSSGFIQITVLALDDGTFELHLRDNAVEFNPFSLEGGYVLDSDDLDATGILMIRRRAREFFYRRFQGFNTLVITV